MPEDLKEYIILALLRALLLSDITVMFIKKYKISKLIIVLALTFFLAPTLSASAACFSCCPEMAVSENSLHFDSDNNCHETNNSIMSCCLSNADDSRIFSDENNRRFEKYLPLLSALTDCNSCLRLANNYLGRYIPLIASPPHLDSLSTILKRE